jgi:hypothetical protein
MIPEHRDDIAPLGRSARTDLFALFAEHGHPPTMSPHVGDRVSRL